MTKQTSAGCNPVERELDIFDAIKKHQEHKRQCPKCKSEDVKFAKHFIDNQEKASAHCYECEHEEVATLDKAEALIDNWFNV